MAALPTNTRKFTLAQVAVPVANKENFTFTWVAPAANKLSTIGIRCHMALNTAAEDNCCTERREGGRQEQM
ncbi:MAG TPA: hypothetical protein DIT01_18885 [Lentisphaeria bacterium]|nr:hypothetical protein [Lentisphaeria bacterium]